jgi:hypothetical protein
MSCYAAAIHTGLSLRVRAKNASSVEADIQTGADPGLSLQRGWQHRTHCYRILAMQLMSAFKLEAKTFNN